MQVSLESLDRVGTGRVASGDFMAAVRQVGALGSQVHIPRGGDLEKRVVGGYSAYFVRAIILAWHTILGGGYRSPGDGHGRREFAKNLCFPAHRMNVFFFFSCY